MIETSTQVEICENIDLRISLAVNGGIFSIQRDQTI